MKQFTGLVAVALAGGVLWSGCGKTEETPARPPAASPAPAVMEPAVPAPSPAPAVMEPAVPAPEVPAVVQPPPASSGDLLASATSGVEQAMALSKGGKYQEALAVLQQKAAEVQADPEAMKLINGAMEQVKQMMADAATQGAADKAGEALGGLGK